ncbi:MAG TPA: amidohydrolase family protein [Candidatus Nitrosopolaris sp.]|nr:amidohydrolase family protein [Candidatus Nitrosopolaris sp.]
MRELRLISADSHVVEPLTLWAERVDGRFRARAPHLEREVGGRPGAYMVCEDAPTVSLQAYFGAGLSADEIAAAFTEEQPGIRRGGFDPVARVADMAQDGVVAEVLYPSIALQLFRLGDGALQAECFRAYNGWLAEFCRQAPQRFAGVALVSLADVPVGVRELERARGLGLRGAMVWCAPPQGDSYASEKYAPFWDAAAATGTPVSLHLGTNRELAAPGESLAIAYMMTIQPVQRALAQLILGGVLDGLPTLRIVSVENEIGWLPHFLARLDHGAEKYRAVAQLTLTMRPSELFRRHVVATFQEDALGVELRHRIGVENLMWASDYPHMDSTWPRSREVIARDFVAVPDAERALILGGNAARLYGFS